MGFLLHVRLMTGTIELRRPELREIDRISRPPPQTICFTRKRFRHRVRRADPDLHRPRAAVDRPSVFDLRDHGGLFHPAHAVHHEGQAEPDFKPGRPAAASVELTGTEMKTAAGTFRRRFFVSIYVVRSIRGRIRIRRPAQSSFGSSSAGATVSSTGAVSSAASSSSSASLCFMAAIFVRFAAMALLLALIFSQNSA